MRTTSSLASMERSNVSLATSHENCPCALGDCSQWAHGDIFEWAYFAGNICEHMWTWDFTRNHSVFLCAFSSWSQVFLASLVSWRHRKVAAMAKFTSRHTKQTTVIRNMMWWRTPRSVSCCSWALFQNLAHIHEDLGNGVLSRPTYPTCSYSQPVWGTPTQLANSRSWTVDLCRLRNPEQLPPRGADVAGRWNLHLQIAPRWYWPSRVAILIYKYSPTFYLIRINQNHTSSTWS